MTSVIPLNVLTLAGVAQQALAGQVRALVIGSEKRNALLPNANLGRSDRQARSCRGHDPCPATVDTTRTTRSTKARLSFDSRPQTAASIFDPGRGNAP